MGTQGDFLHHVHGSASHSCQKVDTAQVSLRGQAGEHTWHVHTVAYHSATERREALPHATTCVNLEGTLLGERSESQKDCVQQGQRHRGSKQIGCCQRAGGAGSDCPWDQVSSWGDRMFWNEIEVVVA